MNPPAHGDFPTDEADRISRVCDEASDGLRACRGDLLAQLHVCARYFERGKQEGIDHGALIDFLGISTPSVLDRAGYRDEEALLGLEKLPLLVEDKEGILRAPTSIPQTSLPPFNYTIYFEPVNRTASIKHLT